MLLLEAGCAVVRPPSLPPPPAEKPQPTPLELHGLLIERDVALRSFQGQGRLEYDGPDGKLRSANMVVVKAPDKVRIDFRSPFSLTYTVVSDGTELLAYDRGEKVLYRGRPSPQNFGRYTRVPVDLSMLVSLVRGLPPMPGGPGAGRVLPVEQGWLWEASLETGGRLGIVFDRQAWLPRLARLEGSGRDFVAYFEEYDEVSGMPTAHRIRAELPGGGVVKLEYGTIWRDRTHGDNAFHIEAPAGVRVVNMDG